MKLTRRRWALLIALGAFALLLVLVGLTTRNARLRAVAENTAKAEELKLLLDQRFPAGTLESDFVPVLKREYPNYVAWPATGSAEYGLPVGDEPSDVWYCGSWSRGVTLRFESGRLVSTSVTRWSADCL
jgi:hypothetical protein